MPIPVVSPTGPGPVQQKGPGPKEQKDAAPEGLPASRLRMAVARMARRLRPTAAAGSLTTTEVDILLVASKRGPARMSDFAAFCGLNPTMLSRLVPKLEDAGLLARLDDPADRRVALVAATEQARDLLDKVRSERDDALHQLLEGLSPPELEAVQQALPVLEKLAELLQEGPSTFGPGGRR